MGLRKAFLHRKRALLGPQSMQEAAMIRKKGTEDRLQQRRSLARQQKMHLVQVLG